MARRYGRARPDDDADNEPSSKLTPTEKALLVTGALVVAVLLAGIITWLTLIMTPVYTDQVRAPVNRHINHVQTEVTALQTDVAVLQTEINNLIEFNGTATALQLPDGTVLRLLNVLPGQLLVRSTNPRRRDVNDLSDEIIGVTPNAAFIIGALGYTPENVANKGVADGYASLDGSGLVPVGQLPPSAFVHFYFISNSAQLPTLTSANVGDYAVIYNATSGNNVYYVLSQLPPTTSGNWLLLAQSSATGAYVLTVAGPGSPAPLTGPHVVLTNQDLGYPYQQGGNAFGASGALGLVDSFQLRLIAANNTFVLLDPGLNVTTFVVPVRLNSVSSALLAADGTGLVKGATLGAGLALAGTTLSNTGVLGLVSNSSAILVAQEANGIWSVLFNVAVPSATALTAGAGVVITQTGPSNFTIANSGVLAIVSNSSAILVAQDANGIWSLLLNAPAPNVTLVAGPGINITSLGPLAFGVANTGVISLVSTSPVLVVTSIGNGTWSLFLNVSALPTTSIAAGAGIVVTQAGPSNFTIANSGVLTIVSNSSAIVVAQEAGGVWSLFLDQTLLPTTNLTAGAGIVVTPTGPTSYVISTTAVLGLVSNSSGIVVAQDASGIWSLLLNVPAPNVTLVAGPGINITSLGPLAFGVANTGVISLVSASPDLVVTSVGNGTWSLFLNVSALPTTTVAAGAGISVTNPSPGVYVVANAGLLGANVTGPGLALTVTPDGIAAFTSTALTEVFTYGGGLSSSQNANGTVILTNTGLLGANVTGPGLALTVTPDGIAAFTSSCINEVFTFGSGLTSTQFANGTVILSTTGGAGVSSVVATDPLFNSGTSTAVNLTLGLSGVTAGSFTYSSITVDAYGRLTAAASGTAPVTSVAVTAPVTNTGTATAPNIGLVNSGVTAATYTYSTITVTAKGIVTSAASGTTPVTSVLNTLPITNSGTATAPNLGLQASGVTPGTYTHSTVVVNSNGLITSASSGTAVASVTATAPLTNTGTATNPVIALSNSGVSPLTYIFSTVSVNALGLVTSASSGTFLTTSPVTNLGTAQNPNFGLVASGATAGSYSLPTLTVTSTGVVTAISTNANLYFCVYALSGQTITSESDIAFGHISAQSAGWTFSPSSSNIQQATYTGATTRALSISYNVVLLRTGSTGTSVCCFVVVNGSVVGGTDSYCLPASATSTTLNFAMTVTATIALNQATSVACLVDDTYNVVYAQMSTRWT